MNSLYKTRKYLYVAMISLGFLFLRYTVITREFFENLQIAVGIEKVVEPCPDFANCIEINGAYELFAKPLTLLAIPVFIISLLVFIILSIINFFKKRSQLNIPK